MASLVGVIAVGPRRSRCPGEAIPRNGPDSARCCLTQSACTKGNAVTRMGYQVGKITDQAVPDGRECSSALIQAPGTRRRAKSILADQIPGIGPDSTRPSSRPGSGDRISVQNSYTPRSISEITGSAADLIEAIAPTTTPARWKARSTHSPRHRRHRSVAGEADENCARGGKEPRSDSFRYRCDHPSTPHR